MSLGRKACVVYYHMKTRTAAVNDQQPISDHNTEVVFDIKLHVILHAKRRVDGNFLAFIVGTKTVRNIMVLVLMSLHSFRWMRAVMRPRPQCIGP